MEESWQRLFHFVVVFMKVGCRDATAKAELAAAAGAEGGSRAAVQ